MVRDECEHCGETDLSFLDRRFGHCRRDAQGFSVKVRRALKGRDGSGQDYRADLARFANDPRAYVDGPRALKKLVDQTKRENDVAFTAATPSKPKQRTSKEILRVAYERAKARGFTS
jgi:hypothetical protein